MGIFDGRSSSPERRHSTSHKSHSPTRSSAGKGYYVRSSNPKPSSSSTFGGSRGIFSSSNNGSSSYYNRRPRQGYIAMLIERLRRMVKELWYYAKKNPVKAFFAVVVPLLSAGGAVHGILRQFGVKIPGLDGGRRSMGGGYYGSQGYGGGGGAGGIGDLLGGGGGWMSGAGSLINVARAFM